MRAKALRSVKGFLRLPRTPIQVRRNDGENARHGELSGYSVSDAQLDIIFPNYSKIIQKKTLSRN